MSEPESYKPHENHRLYCCANCGAPNSNIEENCPKCGFSIFRDNPNEPVKRTIDQNNRLHGLLMHMGLMQTKEDLVSSFTNHRTTHSSEMTFDECDTLIKHLGDNQPVHKKGSKDKMRKKIIGIAHDMGWKLEDGKIDLERIDAFLLSTKSANKKKLNDLKHDQLQLAIHQFEQLREYQFNNV